jgi:uncharacterized protein with beta-barrel porin domain
MLLFLELSGISMMKAWAGSHGIVAAGVENRSTPLRMRNVFLGTVAAGALSLAFGGPALAANDACSFSGLGNTIETCSGNQALGVSATPGVITLNVNTLTTAIAPASGTPGISFNSAGAVTITSNTGAFGITTANANGIYAIGPLAVTVTSAGNITTAGTSANGIFAADFGTGAVTVTSIGNITTAGSSAFGINAASAGTGSITVSSTGSLTTEGVGSSGILANGNGAITVTSTGNITTAGLSAQGIFAVGNGTGAVTVTSTGNIAVAGTNTFGIVAEGTGAVAVTSTGNVTASSSVNSNGIAGASTGGPINIIVNSGTVSGGSGVSAGVVFAGGTNNTLTNKGTVTALSGFAIVGEAFNNVIPGGNNTVNNFGTVIGSVILDATTLSGNTILGGGGGVNAFNNMVGGVFNSGATVSLGAGNTLTNAGTLSPGGAGVIQTTALTGNLVQTATGRLLSDINIAGGTSDRVNVSGTATLAGAVQLQVSNLTLAPWQATVLSATGGTTNNGLALLASPALQAQLVFPNATDIVVKSTGINFLTPGLNNNQIALGNALNGAAQNGGFGGAGAPIFNALLNGVTSLSGYSLALNQLSGEAATGTQQTTFDVMNLFMSTMLDPFNRGATSAPGSVANGYAAEGDASAYASDGRKRTTAERDAYAMFTKTPLAKTWEPRWSVWAAGFGGSQTTDGNAAVGSNGSTSRIAGTVVGADYIFSPNTIAGFALAGGGTSYSVGNGLGSGRSDLFQAGVYMRHTMGAAYIAGALAYGWQDITTNRTVTLAGLDQLQARFNANAFSGRVEGGYRFVGPWIGGIGITPYAAAQFTTFDLPAYAEQATVGTNNFALAYGAKSVTDPRSEVGFRTDKSYAVQDGILTLRSRFAWAHDYDPSRSIGATFQTLPGASFVVNGAAQASDSVLTTASIEMKWRNNWSIAATFEGEFSNVTSSYAGKGVVRYAW